MNLPEAFIFADAGVMPDHLVSQWQAKGWQKMSRRNFLKAFFALTGVAMIANGVWMEMSAFQWFLKIPADMPATGQPNGHMIRDVGLAYAVFGTGLIWCGSRLQECRPVFLGVSFFMVGHAIGHVVEILLDLLPQSHWWIDFPLVFLPGLIFGALAIRPLWAWATTP